MQILEIWTSHIFDTVNIFINPSGELSFGWGSSFVDMGRLHIEAVLSRMLLDIL